MKIKKNKESNMKSDYHLYFNEEKKKWEWVITAPDLVLVTEWETLKNALEGITLSYAVSLVKEMLEKNVPMELILKSMSEYYLAVTKSSIKQAKKDLLNEQVKKNNNGRGDTDAMSSN
jgi:hypothetical protein